MSESGDWLIDRAIKKAAIDPIRIQVDDEQPGDGLIHRAKSTGHFAAARKFGQLWHVESGSPVAPQCLPTADSHIYLLCIPLLQSGSTRISIGGLEVKTVSKGSRLEWIWLHPHFRRSITNQEFAAEALKSVARNYPVFEMGQAVGGISGQRMAKLWGRAFPTP